MELKDILKYYKGTLTEFRTWLVNHKTEVQNNIVYIHPEFDEVNPGETGWLYVRGAFFTCTATGTDLVGDGKYIVINNNTIQLKSEMILNRDDIDEVVDDEALVTKGYLDAYHTFEELNK